ncbi:arylsulfatase [Marinobacterium sp. D7]|uniref:arylsulfatase n=1 Tax=Marinobacterium ramblicola TaxID=2849041 RepID=UPI001C2D1610|nr:arylsulfatase [Marinobacterium ramblicola]MBV1788686.1 arylsulfatase [Marinobacterium ramblicola]
MIAPLALSGCTLFAAVAIADQSNVADRRPNILVIVADDLGYSDLSAFGSEIQTPNIDALASSGRILTNFHTAAVCSPTRASLLSGVDHHLAGLGNMAEVVGLNIVQNKPFNAPWGRSNTYDFDNIPEGYQGYLSPKALSMAELLRDGGYHTYMVGKWHLAYETTAPTDERKSWFKIKPEALPYARGFEQSFSLINGGAAHFAPTNPPTPLDLVMYAENERVFPSKQLPENFFSTEAYTDKLIGYIDSGRNDGKPFFAYAAYTAPHWPLQAPAEDIAQHKGEYDAGYAAIREARVARMKALGLIPQAMQPSAGVPGPSEGGTGPKRWHELSDEERSKEARVMEIYAAMITNLDRHVGRLIDHLKQIGEYDNTLIMFMSDNGAEGADAFILPIPGTQVDNGFDNLGHPGSAVAYGARWAEVSAAPFRLFKGFTGAEGGTSAPLIVRLPQQESGRPTSDARLHVTDILPTLLDIAGIANPGSVYNGRTVHPIEGVSLLSALRQPEAFAAVRSKDDVIADELMGASYVVKGPWKLSQQPSLDLRPIMRDDVPFKLFNIEQDRGETTDLSQQYPDTLSELLKERGAYIERAGVVEQAQTYSGR